MKINNPVYKLSFFLFLLLSGYLLFQNQEEKIEPIPVFRRATNEIPDTLNHHKLGSIEQALISNLMVEGLFSVNEFSEIEPTLVQEWNSNEDDTVYHFKIKDDIYFHDNSLMSSKDVVSSLNDLIKDQSVQRDWYRKIKKIDLLESNWVRIELRRPIPNLILQLAGDIIKVSKPSKNSSYRIGTGPFKFDRITRFKGKKVLRLKQFEAYHKKRPAIMIFEFWELNELDTIQLSQQGFIHDASGISLQPNLINASKKLVKVNNPGFITRLISFNARNPKLQKIDDRICLANLFPKKEVVNRFFAGEEIATGYLPHSLMGSNINPSLRKSENCKNIKNKELVLDYSGKKDNAGKMCAFLKDRYKKNDIVLRCNSIVFSQLIKRIREKKAELSFLTINMGKSTDNSYFGVFNQFASFNVSNFYSPKFKKLQSKELIAQNNHEKVKIRGMVNQYLYNNAVTISISYPQHVSYIHSCLKNYFVPMEGISLIDFTRVRLKANCSYHNDFQE